MRDAIGDVAQALTYAAEADRRRREELYRSYMTSPAWLESSARLGEIRASGCRCRLCNRAPPAVRLEVHHRTYENFGREVVADLTTLCSECHATVTAMLRERRGRLRPSPFRWRS